jgi:hypothetical protein
MASIVTHTSYSRLVSDLDEIENDNQSNADTHHKEKPQFRIHPVLLDRLKIRE